MIRRFILFVFILCAAELASAHILLSPDSLKIISPNGGEKFLTGSDTVITWTGIPLTDTVKLEYSTDAGTSWNFITDTATGGRYAWHVPKTVSDSCLVRVEQLTLDFSNGWVKQVGGLSYDDGRCITVDILGNLYVTGQFKDSANFGGIILRASNNESDFFIAKYQSDGTIEWAKCGLNSEGSYGSGIAIDSFGNIYCIGTFYNQIDFDTISFKGIGDHNMFVAKYHNDGTVEWAKQFGLGLNGSACSIACDQSGNLIICGGYSSVIDLGGIILTSKYGYEDMFIAKYDPTGKLLWAKTDDEVRNYYNEATSIALDKFGNSYITGWFDDTISIGGILLKGGSIFFAKYSPDGTVKLVKSDYGNGIPGGLAVDTFGNIFITGYFQSWQFFDTISLKSTGARPNDVFITKYNPSGIVEWAHRCGGSGNDQGRAVITDLFGNVYITGFFSGIADFGPFTLYNKDDSDYTFVAKYLPDGNIDWVKQGGNKNNVSNFCCESGGITIDADNNLFVTGSFSNNADFCNVRLKSSGERDIFIWKISSPLPLQTDTSVSLFSIIKPKTLLSIPNDSGYAGNHKNIPLALKNAPVSSVQSLAPNFSARIAYDRTVLYPTTGSIQHGARFDTVTISGSISSDSLLASIPFTAMLGESTFSPMKIVDFKWLDGLGQQVDIDVATDSGTFYLLGVCPAGGTRLYNPDGQVSMAHVTQNPANGMIHIEIQTIETGRTQLDLMNLLGQKVATISDGELKPGIYSFDFNSQSLPTGSYFLTLTTPTVRRMERVDISK